MAVDETLLDGLSALYGEEISRDSKTLSKIDVALYEMQDVYQEVQPYSVARTLTGDRYLWNEGFIDRLLYALSTDDLTDFGESEYQIVMGFINFQDSNSTSPTQAQANDGATGCTLQNIDGISYVIYGEEISTDICLDASVDVPRATIYASLDNVLMSILNCIDWQNQEIITGELESVSPCTI
jgi:hypothetical protein